MNPLIDIYNNFKQGNISKDDYIEKLYSFHLYLWQLEEFVKNKNIKNIEITSNNIILTTSEEVKFFIPEGDMRAPPIEVINFGDYEKKEIDLMRKILKKDQIMLDIGANIGWYCINLSKNVEKIIAFEPIKSTFDILKKNIQLNNIKNVECCNFGLSNEQGDNEFYYYPSISGAASMRNLYLEKERMLIKCHVKRLDDIRNIKKIDFIKCDVEGSELYVMQGAVKTLKNHKPILFLEMLRKWSNKFDYHPNDIIKFLASIGYECYAIGDLIREVKKVTEETIETNFIFLDPKKHDTSIIYE